jgi:isochorismate synthase
MPETDIFEKLRKHYDQKLPFVVYRKPEAGMATAFLQQHKEVFSVEDFTEAGFVFAPFDDQEQAILIPEAASEKIIFNVSEIDDQKGEIAEAFNSEASEAEKQRHISLVKKGLLELNSQELQKVVLSRKEMVRLNDADPFKLFKDLLSSYQSAFVYLWYHPQVGMWLGATPETLLKTEGNRFKTMALAGTQSFRGTLEVNWGEKERQEQQYVTDEILARLEGLVEDLKTSEVHSSRAGNLLHLRTEISGRIPFKTGGSNSAGLKNIITALHPTPAVCGLPKEKAKKFILSEEGYDREFYTGFLGELNLQSSRSRSGNRRNVENLAYRTVKKETALFVNLRCMKLLDKAAQLFIGGGITKESDPAAEWEETVNKSQTMKKVLI